VSPAVAAGIPILNIGSVADVQRALNTLTAGAVPDAEFGALGPKTRAALIEFQKTYMLAPTGDIDHQTRTELAKVLGLLGIATFVPAVATTTGAGAPLAAGPAVDRSTQIQQQAVRALTELRAIGLPAVANALRHVLGDPSMDALRRALTSLSVSTSGVFANQIAALWKPVLDGFALQPDPDAALRAALPAQLAPLLTQLDAVLGSVTELASSPTVDQLRATVAVLLGPQGGALGAKLAQSLQAFLMSITAPSGAARPV
jgi:peptidoglycan hydrolase-like protein with peptidoglycan-binding domain